MPRVRPPMTGEPRCAWPFPAASSRWWTMETGSLRVDVAGVQRNVNIGLLDADAGGGVGPGDWVLIHVGFALSQVDEEEAQATLELLRAWATSTSRSSRSSREPDRVTASCTPARDPTCITCGDVGVAMRVIEVDEARCARALRERRAASAARSRSRSSTPARATRCSCTRGRRSREVRRRVPRRRARPGAGRRDPLDRRARPPLQGHGGVRRAHALDLQVRPRRPAARQRRARARARAARSA